MKRTIAQVSDFWRNGSCLRSLPVHHHRHYGARWRVTLLAAVALAALAGCASASARATATITPTPTYRLGGKFATATAQSWTPTLPPDAAAHMPIAGTQLQWKAANLPSGFGFSFHQSWLDVSTNNGATAYSCSQSMPAQAIQAVVTHDAGATWSQVASVNQPWDGCMTLTADALNPRIVVMNGGGGGYALTLNGGQSWRYGTNATLSSIASLATVGSRTYMLSYNGGAGGSSPRLFDSTDGFASWHDISPPMGSQAIHVFWANPASGGLLVETQQDYTGTITLWRSSDGGASWTRNNLSLGDYVSALVASPLRGSSTWMICADKTGPSCSTDSGATWKALPQLIDTGVGAYKLFAVTGDGSVLAFGMTGLSFPIYRLAPGATRWQTLGPAPTTMGTLRYTPASGSDGYIWSFPSIKGGGSGDSNPSDVLVARYPY